MKRKNFKRACIWYTIGVVLIISLIDICRGYAEAVDISLLAIGFLAIVIPTIFLVIDIRRSKIAKLELEKEQIERERIMLEANDELEKIKQEQAEQERIKQEQAERVRKEIEKTEQERMKQAKRGALNTNIFAALLIQMPDDERITEYADILSQNLNYASVSALVHYSVTGYVKATKIVDTLVEYGLANDKNHRWLPSAFSADFTPLISKREMVNQEIKASNKSTSAKSSKNIVSIKKIDSMIGTEFENYLAELFRHKGYNAEVTPASGDYGIDLIITNDLVRIGVQAKRYSDKVSLSAVQEALGGMKHYNLDKAMVITSNYFQPSAITLAKENGVILWDRDRLIAEMKGV